MGKNKKSKTPPPPAPDWTWSQRLMDTHTHLDAPQFDGDRDHIIQEMRRVGLGNVVNIGCDIESSRRSIQLAEQYDFIYATVGYHPHEAKMADSQGWEKYRELMNHPKVVALGEMGLDYFYNHSSPEVQKQVFDQQLTLAAEANKPVVIHDRDAHEDIYDILTQYRGEVYGVMHTFSGNVDFARRCLDLGFYISFSGVLTFQKSEELREVAVFVPKDRSVIETDSPYLTPAPYRGLRNDPSYVRFTAEKLAELWKVDLEDCVAQTERNGRELFRLPS